MDGEAEARAAKRTARQHAQVIFLKAPLRVADGANDAGGEVGAAFDEIENFVGERILHQAVDGEVAAPGVQSGILLKVNLIGTAAIRVDAFAAKGGDFNVNSAGPGDEDDAKLRANDLGAWEVAQQLIGSRVGTDVEVFGSKAEELIAPHSRLPTRRCGLGFAAGRAISSARDWLVTACWTDLGILAVSCFFDFAMDGVTRTIGSCSKRRQAALGFGSLQLFF